MIYEFETMVYTAVTLFGMAMAILLGYKNAQKDDPSVELDWNCIFWSVIRSLPGIGASAAALIGTVPEVGLFGTVLTVQGLITSFVAPVGSDVMLKRLWNTRKKPSTDALNTATTSTPTSNQPSST